MRLLLLAGTSEARILAKRLSQEGQINVTASLAGVTRQPLDLDVDTRVGGFGGVDGLVEYLEQSKIDAIIDATHPFAQGMSQNAHAAASAMGIPHLIFQRPQWYPNENDNWTELDHLEDVETIIPKGCRVFLGTGRQTLDSFAAFKDRTLLMRVIDEPRNPFPYPGGRFLVGRPPFPIDDEIELFRREQIDWLVVKNSGGSASKSKLDAAAALGLPVALLMRPNRPDVKCVQTQEEVCDWLAGVAKGLTG